MDGRWSFFDSNRIKIADLTYRMGKASGVYQTYFGMKFNPVAAGKLISKGRLHNGPVVGRHVGCDNLGRVWTDAVVGTGRASHVKAGTATQSMSTAESDEGFVQTLDGAIRPALR